MIKLALRVFYKIKWITEDNIKRRSYYKQIGNNYLDTSSYRMLIRQAIGNKEPLCVGKIGATECYAMAAAALFGKGEREKAYAQLCDWSGFFPKEYSVDRFLKFCEIEKAAVSGTDILIEFAKCYEEFILKKIKWTGKNVITFATFEDMNDSWTKELVGKNVLVIHPFANLIEEQYKKRELLFEDKDYMPEFRLFTIKAVQSLGGTCEEGYSDWFEALNSMVEKMKKIEFDILLVGCGAYGLPLAYEAKKMGKVAIHMGGDLQLLFGIKGKRWDKGFGEKYYNEHWVYPEGKYKPQNYKTVENGCYW